MIDGILDAIVTILITPLQVVLIPIDALLAKIPILAQIPSYISPIVSWIGDIPKFIVYVLGVNPELWNALFLIVILQLTLLPAINVIKMIIAWIRGT